MHRLFSLIGQIGLVGEKGACSAHLSPVPSAGDSGLGTWRTGWKGQSRWRALDLRDPAIEGVNNCNFHNSWKIDSQQIHRKRLILLWRTSARVLLLSNQTRFRTFFLLIFVRTDLVRGSLQSNSLGFTSIYVFLSMKGRLCMCNNVLIKESESGFN